MNSRFRSGLLVTIIVLMAGGVGWTLSAPIALAQSVCGTRGYNWYGQATSGTGSTEGTRMTINMPANYYAPGETTSDEAAWLIDFSIASPGVPNSGTELGYFTGYFPYNGLTYGSPVAYYTINDGGTGYVPNATAIPASTQQAFTISLYGGDLSAPTFAEDISYSVDYPRTNMSQGEIASQVQYNDGSAWMGGNSGGGTTAWGYYQPSGNPNLYAWGSFTMCDNSPYWIYSKAANSWKNGGS